MKGACTIDGCDRRLHNRHWCATHYKRWLRHGDPETYCGPSDARLPFEPLVPYIEAQWRPISDKVSHISIHGKAQQVIGANRSNVHRWRRRGLTLDSADRCATALGLHPANVWPEWWEVAA